MNGTHIVMDRESVVHMMSSTNGIPVNSPDGYDELVYSDVHISDSGEYVHAAPWSVGEPGSRNVSHGCINLSPTTRSAFFELQSRRRHRAGRRGPRPPELGDHGVMDWDTDWSQWTLRPRHSHFRPRLRRPPPRGHLRRSNDLRSARRERLFLSGCSVRR